MDAFIVYVVFNPASDSNKQSNNNSCKEVKATLIPFSSSLDRKHARDIPTACCTRLRIYPMAHETLRKKFSPLKKKKRCSP